MDNEKDAIDRGTGTERKGAVDPLVISVLPRFNINDHGTMTGDDHGFWVRYADIREELFRAEEMRLWNRAMHVSGFSEEVRPKLYKQFDAEHPPFWRKS